MGKGSNINSNTDIEHFTYDAFSDACKNGEKLIIVNGNVYNVANWMKKHPGGGKIIGHFIGQDATEVWAAMHNDKELVKKYLKPLLVGKLEQNQNEVQRDMADLRKTVEENGWFKTNPWFFIAHLSHIIVLELLALWVFCQFGTGWCPYIMVAFILATSQESVRETVIQISTVVGGYLAQAGWSQHDYGHLSVFKSSWMNHFAHQFVIGHLKAASSHWWNFRHFQHHAKPNIIRKDPDIGAPMLFLLGDKMPVSWAKKRKGFMPYDWQHHYFWFFGPSILLPVYFHLEVLFFVFKRRDWIDLCTILSFFVRFSLCYAGFIGLSHWDAFCLYMFTRFIESFWFTMVTQMSHIPMEIDNDKGHDWLTSQTMATCNVEPSWFNDWFTGHLNFQIEHHLFPTMPRHNYIKVMPLAKALCKKHKLPYVVKPLGTALCDIVRSLRKSGQLWYDAYYG